MDRANNEFPLVSICIPTYNSEKYIEKMLSGIHNQTYPNLEVIVCDNCSLDRTYEILLGYSNLPNWHILQNSYNIGALNNMSKLIELATGKYTSLYHADDLYEPEIVAKSVEIFEQKSSVGLVSTMGYSIDHNSEIISRFTLPKSFENRTSLSFETVFLEILSQRPFFLITPSVMTRTIYYKENSRFRERYKSSADYGMWFDILQKSDLYIINEPLIHYRTHDQQGSQLEIKANYKIPDSLPLYYDYAKRNKKMYWRGYLHSYFKLMLIQAFKLNNAKNYRKSQVFLRMILRRSQINIFPWVILLLFFNAFRISINLDKLIKIKKLIKR